MVDGFAAAAALPLYLPVLEPGDDVFDAGPDPAVRPVAVVAARGGDRGGDRRDAAASAVADDDTTIKQLGQGVAGHDDVVAVTWPALAGYHDSAPVGADDDLGVDAAAAVLAGGGDRLVVRRGIRVPSTMHGWLLLLGVSISASGGTRWQMMRSAVDWLVPNGAAGARVVRLGA